PDVAEDALMLRPCRGRPRQQRHAGRNRHRRTSHNRSHILPPFWTRNRPGSVFAHAEQPADGGEEFFDGAEPSSSSRLPAPPPPLLTWSSSISCGSHSGGASLTSPEHLRIFFENLRGRWRQD